MLRFELLSWIFIALIVAVVQLPIYLAEAPYPFYLTNTIYVTVFLLAVRYLFFLRFSFLAYRQILKIALIFLTIPLVFHLSSELNHFQTTVDEEGKEAFVGALPYGKGDSLFRYIYNEMLLFGTGSIISSILLAFRLLISIWRVHNRGTV